ncbi:cytochrome c1 [Gallaecimonas kandeliae]|uniref:cytochrome c1 n=1 Tax=Gallaecimonas kandeliae TaxID=3029055 RepID=UPI002649E4F7|nr:cytochrome c1 [Gallaecimonas kandeliae]WKE66068.1 cytochrome c1 [Gallaecimonas kandeliae]
MKRLLIALLAMLPLVALAEEGEVHLDKAHYDLTDKASLQRGARMFMNYCFGCHQMQYQRYVRTADDLGIPHDLMEQNLIFTGAKIGDHMKNAMPAEKAAVWFGKVPPDLTLVARVRGPDWIYTYLRSFYVDESRPWGVNNEVFKDVGMPHVLQELQGVPRKTYETRLVDGEEKEVYAGIKADGTGELSAEEYDKAVLDLVNFLVYTGEPMRLEAESIGWKVLVFLAIFFVIAYFLKKEYWRDVH